MRSLPRPSTFGLILVALGASSCCFAGGGSGVPACDRVASAGVCTSGPGAVTSTPERVRASCETLHGTYLDNDSDCPTEGRLGVCTSYLFREVIYAPLHTPSTAAAECNSHDAPVWIPD